jgi:hypothetical protein
VTQYSRWLKGRLSNSAWAHTRCTRIFNSHSTLPSQSTVRGGDTNTQNNHCGMACPNCEEVKRVKKCVFVAARRFHLLSFCETAKSGLTNCKIIGKLEICSILKLQKKLLCLFGDMKKMMDLWKFPNVCFDGLEICFQWGLFYLES